jgi:hypothetical protein
MDGVILVILLLLVFVFVIPLAAIGKASGAASEVRALRRRIDELERRLRELGEAPSDLNAVQKQLSALEGRLQKLDGGAPVEIVSEPETTVAKQQPTKSTPEPGAVAEWDEAREVPAAASLPATAPKPLQVVLKWSRFRCQQNRILIDALLGRGGCISVRCDSWGSRFLERWSAGLGA